MNVNKSKKAELLSLVKGLSELSEDNRDYIKNFLSSGSSAPRSELALKRRKKVIYKELVNLDDYVGLPNFDFDEINKQLKDFRNIHADYPLEVLELWIYTISTSYESLVDYQMQDDFFELIAEWYDETAQMAADLRRRGLPVEDYINELKRFWDAAEEWDYDDRLKESFEKYLQRKE